MMHQVPTLQSLLKLEMLVFQLFSILWIDNKDDACCMWSTLLWTFTKNMTWFSTTQTKIICTSMLFLLPHEGLESCLINLYGVIVCVADGAKLLSVVNVGSWRLSYQCSNNPLSH
jgi:hypothetical protein